MLTIIEKRPNESLYKEAKIIAEQCTVEELEKMILTEYYDVQRECMNEKLDAYLTVRRWKLNSEFEWTPEAIEKFLALDKKMIECFERLYQEAEPLYAVLNKRKDEDKNFDFEIEPKVRPSILLPDNDTGYYAGGGINHILINEWPEHFVLTSPSLRPEDRADNDYLNKDFNYNIYFSEVFKGHYISYCMYEFHNHQHYWSIPDILKINNFWADLSVEYQHELFI